MNERWFLSGKYLPIFVFVLFPLFYVITSYVTDYSNPFFRNEFVFDIFWITPFFVIIGPFGSLSLPISLSIVLLFFAFFPSILPTPKLFNLRGYENVVIEYKILIKILLGAIIVLIILIIINYFAFNYVTSSFKNPELLGISKQIETLTQNYFKELENMTGSTFEKGKQLGIRLSEDEQYKKLTEQFNAKIITLDPKIPIYSNLSYISFNTIYMVLPIPVSILIKLLLERYRKYFTLYYVKGCFKLVSKEKMEIDKAKYLQEGLLWYNRFLNKNINLQLSEITRIYSKIITDTPLRTNKDVILLSDSFENEDELFPLRTIATHYPNTVEPVLSKESMRNRIKESSDMIIPIISVVITVITTFLLPKPP